jgi:hypothetical protein
VKPVLAPAALIEKGLVFGDGVRSRCSATARGDLDIAVQLADDFRGGIRPTTGVVLTVRRVDRP